jgi:hypothetical protein
MEPTTTLTITLEAQQWNQVMATLAEGPFRIVAPLIQEMQRQCLAQDAQQQPTTLGRGNGTVETLHPVA